MAPATSAGPKPYGGNTDFCADGHVWGEPDLDHAAELMQQVAARRLALVSYRVRLEELWAQRQELAGRLKWRADTAV